MLLSEPSWCGRVTTTTTDDARRCRVSRRDCFQTRVTSVRHHRDDRSRPFNSTQGCSSEERIHGSALVDLIERVKNPSVEIQIQIQIQIQSGELDANAACERRYRRRREARRWDISDDRTSVVGCLRRPGDEERSVGVRVGTFYSDGRVVAAQLRSRR